jgi:hypothetical protein
VQQVICKLKIAKCSWKVIKLDNNHNVWGWKKTRFFLVQIPPIIFKCLNLPPITHGKDKLKPHLWPWLSPLSRACTCHLTMPPLLYGFNLLSIGLKPLKNELTQPFWSLYEIIQYKIMLQLHVICQLVYNSLICQILNIYI